MQQDARTDPDLEAYGDWVTVDATVPPAPRAERPTAPPDAEVAGELTEAEEEFLGRLSEAGHAGAPVPGPTPDQATGAVPGLSAKPGGETAALDPSSPPSPEPASAAVGSEEVPNGLPAWPRSAAVGTPEASPRSGPPLAAPASGATMPASHDSDDALGKLATVEPELTVELVAAAQAPAPTASDVPTAPIPENLEPPEPAATASAEAPEQLEQSVAAETLAALQERLASLAANVAEVTEQVARLQAHGGDPPPAEADSGPGQVAVMLEELADEAPASAVDTAETAALAAADAAQDDGSGAPAMWLEPLRDSDAADASPREADLPVTGLPGTVPAASPREADPPAMVHDATSAAEAAPDTFREDVRRVLVCLDNLLDSLPPEKIREFAQSSDFATYKKLFTELGIDG